MRQEGELRPGQRLPVSYRFTLVYADAPGQAGTERISVKVEYTDAEEKPHPLSRSAPVTIEPRKDIIRSSSWVVDQLAVMLPEEFGGVRVGVQQNRAQAG
jgi:hypothetical protein